MREPKQFVQNIFEETGQSERDAENLANALTRLTGDLYTETERFIFEKIGYHIFLWIAQLAQNQTYKNQITSLIPSKYTASYGESSETEDAFNIGFDLAIENVAFLPCEDNDFKLLKTHEAIIDEIEITRVLGTEIIRHFFDAQLYFISNSLENKRNLKYLKIKTFDVTELCNFFEESQEYKDIIKDNPLLNFQVIEHLRVKNISTTDLVSIPFILDEEENIISPENLYFQIDDAEKALLNFANFHFIHPWIIDDAMDENEILITWLKKHLKIKVFSGIKIIKERINHGKYLPDEQESGEQNLDICLNYVRFIFKYYTKLSAEYCKKLKNLELIYQKQESYYLAPAKFCYLSNFYKPHNRVEDIASSIGEENFQLVTSKYCNNENDISKWKEFFISIGVSDSNGLEIIHSKIIPMIEHNEIDDSNTINITRFIFKVWKNFTLNSEDSEVLKNLPLMTNDGLQIASKCNLSNFYTNNRIENITLADVYLPNLVSEEYYCWEDSITDWRRFFTSVLAVENSQEVELIQKKIQQLADQPNLVTTQNAVEICRQIFKFYEYLTKDDLNKLCKLKLLLVNGQLAQANKCYFSNHYHPKLNLESFYKNTDFEYFVSSIYSSNDTDKEKWKVFFKDIGVEEELRFINISEYYLSTDNERIKEYFIYIDIDIFQDSYQFQNIIHFPHRKYLSNSDFAKIFWEYINFHWNNLNLEQKSIVLIDNISKQVDSIFKFSIHNYDSIPCNDGKSHSSSEGIYSSRLKKIVGDNFLVANCNLKEEIENFIGLKQQLDLQDCLELLDNLAELYHDNTSKEENRLNLIYEQLFKYIREGLNDDDREIISDWLKTGRLLACDDKFYSASQLYYLDIAMGLTPKRNSNLIKFSDSNLNSLEFEEILEALGIKKIGSDDMQFELCKDVVDETLPNLIKDRAIFISIFLNGSYNPRLEDKIKSLLRNIKFYNPSKIVITCKDIDYKESIPNYYDEKSKSIYYVRKWDSIKNIYLGDYLIDVLALDKGKISNQVLLRLLDDDIEDVKDYLLESGCDIEAIPEDYGKQSCNNTEDYLGRSSAETEATQSDIPSIVSSPDGTGSNIDYWGKWGEDQAQKIYESLGYNAQKQNDFLALGYDFICTSYKRKKLYSEIKTISSNQPMIRLKQSQWRSMCSEDKKAHYELVIVVHEGHSVIEIIRVSSVWATLKNLLSQLTEQYLTEEEYKKQVEVLLGFQQNSDGNANEIIFHWQRLLKFRNHSHINIYPQGVVNSES
ncbi:DUF3883 domain-containing protein [Mastigocoleus sp. MO_188.B34]|uniref:protein NO VEIN domain-containing protein n=1 Tax=Mastigocoleus sp. MO_188.B34 TaxID=3036635 RepID=UPI00261858B3|nr:DUF3883 domain-containing protein [Mastigocoleus sp. MO_188.B34]MDJ0695334.1 DUF3883 domain-containing protein [Mastigocoleus sp. MO_188.B34]